MTVQRFLRLKKILGIVGPLILCGGVFAPVVRVPLLGSLNYYYFAGGDGLILIALALISLVSAVFNKFRALWYTGFSSAVVVGFAYWSLFMRLSELDPLMAQTYQLSWGWAVLIAGIGAIIAAAALTETTIQQSTLH